MHRTKWSFLYENAEPLRATQRTCGTGSALSNAQHRTRSVTGYCVAEIPQAAQDAGLRTSPDHEHIRSQCARRLGQRISNRTDGDADQCVRTSGALQRLDAMVRYFSFRQLQALLQIQFNRQVRPIRGNHMNERKIRMNGFRSLAGISKNPLRV